MIEKLVSKIGIGTAQFGMNYGINNKVGKVEKEVIREILNIALCNNIDTLDTAIGYGDCENVIGTFDKLKKFNVVSKIPACNIDEIDNYVNLSLKNLNLKDLYGCLFHSFEAFKENNKLVDKLKDQKDKGKIKKIGFSLYYTNELDYLIERNINFDLIQVPYNIFDRRFEKYFEKLKNRDVEIHTRSVYLQGLILMKLNTINNYFEGFKRKLTELERISQELKISNQEIALNFCLNNEFVSKVIVGFDNLIQIKEAIQSVNSFETVKEYSGMFDDLTEANENFILPFNWKLH